MSPPPDRPRPHWGDAGSGREHQPVESPPPPYGGDPATEPGLEAIRQELAELRRSVEDRFRSLNRRFDALDTDILRLVTLLRTSQESAANPTDAEPAS